MRFTGPRHIALLDGLRGYAAFVVVLYHLRHFFGDALPVANGYLAVDLFFVMSGLVIAMTYEARLRAGMGVAAFFRRRVIRLYPVYAIGGLLGVAVMLALPEKRMGAGYALSALVSQAAMLPEALVRGADGPFPLNPPAWSLFFEIWGNLAFALLVPRLPTRWLAATVGLALIGYMLGSRAAGTVELGVNYARLAGGLRGSGSASGSACSSGGLRPICRIRAGARWCWRCCSRPCPRATCCASSGSR